MNTVKKEERCNPVQEDAIEEDTCQHMLQKHISNPKRTTLLCLYFFCALSCNLLARQVEIVRDAYARPRIPIIYQSVNEYMPDKPQGSD